MALAHNPVDGLIHAVLQKWQSALGEELAKILTGSLDDPMNLDDYPSREVWYETFQEGGSLGNDDFIKYVARFLDVKEHDILKVMKSGRRVAFYEAFAGVAEQLDNGVLPLNAAITRRDMLALIGMCNYHGYGEPQVSRMVTSKHPIHVILPLVLDHDLKTEEQWDAVIVNQVPVEWVIEAQRIDLLGPLSRNLLSGTTD